MHLFTQLSDHEVEWHPPSRLCAQSIGAGFPGYHMDNLNSGLQTIAGLTILVACGLSQAKLRITHQTFHPARPWESWEPVEELTLVPYIYQPQLPCVLHVSTSRQAVVGSKRPVQDTDFQAETYSLSWMGRLRAEELLSALPSLTNGWIIATRTRNP